MANEMESQGADPDAVAAFLEASLDDDDEDEDIEPPLELWPENEQAFSVFTHCKWDRDVVSTMESAQLIYSGISAAEVHHTCQLLGVPAAQWPTVTGLVRVAINAALPLLNDRAG